MELNLEAMKQEACTEIQFTPMELVRSVMTGSLQNIPSDEISLKEAHKIFSDLVDSDLDCADDPVEVKIVKNRIEIALLLADISDKKSPMTVMDAPNKLGEIKSEIRLEPNVIRDISESIGSLVALVIMDKHGIPFGESGMSDEVELEREQIFEAIMNHVADEMMKGN